MRNFIIAIVIALVAGIALPYTTLQVAAYGTGHNDTMGMALAFFGAYVIIGSLLLVNALGWTLAYTVSRLRGNGRFLTAAAYANVAIAAAYAGVMLYAEINIGQISLLTILITVYGIGWIAALYPYNKATPATTA